MREQIPICPRATLFNPSRKFLRASFSKWVHSNISITATHRHNVITPARTALTATFIIRIADLASVSPVIERPQCGRRPYPTNTLSARLIHWRCLASPYSGANSKLQTHGVKPLCDLFDNFEKRRLNFRESGNSGDVSTLRSKRSAKNANAISEPLQHVSANPENV